MSSYNSDLSQDYLRALSIFKRKLQLLGFYPIVLNDDGLEYVSVDPYLIDDDYDDEMYKLLKKVKKEKKARKKLLKKKAKKTKTKKISEPPVVTTTVQPISNIVYYWPSTITTTIVHPVDGTSTYQHSIDTRIELNENDEKKPSNNESSEEDSSEVDSSSYDQQIKNKKQKPAKINYETSLSFGRELKFEVDDEENQTTISSSSATLTTTPYPFLTVFPDPEELAIQEILNQQEIINKIADNTTKMISTEGIVVSTTELTTVEDNETNAEITAEVPSDVYGENGKDENVSSEPTNPYITSIVVTDPSIHSTESSILIPAGILQFFHETLLDDDEQSSTVGSPSHSEIIDIFPVTDSPNANIFDEITETTENNKNIDGHRETDTQHNHTDVHVGVQTTTNAATAQPIYEHLTIPNSSDDKVLTSMEITLPDGHIKDESEGYEYSIDPKISLPVEVNGDFESRSISPVLSVIVNDSHEKSGRRSDIPIEADDVNDDDDNLPNNLSTLSEQNNTIECK